MLELQAEPLALSSPQFLLPIPPLLQLIHPLIPIQLQLSFLPQQLKQEEEATLSLVSQHKDFQKYPQAFSQKLISLELKAC